MTFQFGREICGDLHIAEQREWLVTNGIGGYACGTVAGILTRHYHGILVAALEPPVGRMLMLTKLDDSVIYRNQIYSLCSNRWADGIVNPEGHHYIEQFYLDGKIPTWRYAFSDAILKKQIWMQQGENTTYVRYTLERGSFSVLLYLKALVNYRNHHGGATLGNWVIEPFENSESKPETVGKGIRVTAFKQATPLYLLTERGRVFPERHWYHNFDLASEQFRGTGRSEDHLHVATVKATLDPGESLTFTASTRPDPLTDGKVTLADRQAYERSLLRAWQTATAHDLEHTPPWIQQLVLASDQFIVNRPSEQEPEGKTIIAGYPWFNDWGRDTMISLPGLTIATGRPHVARPILRTFARYLSQGMLPNLFPDRGQTPEYNTVDAILWYFEAMRAYYEATGDEKLLRDLYPALQEVIDWHVKGTRYNIHLDKTDGLIYAGESGSQLTWMDVKIGDWVVTPRLGKPIEVNALWYNALKSMVLFAKQLGYASTEYDVLAEQTREGFQRFWNPVNGYCFDVLDSPMGNDTSFRPNQIFAVSLPFNAAHAQAPLLPLKQQQQVVNMVGRELLTSHGLRSLASTDPDYHRYYKGTPAERDASYHQGTVWGWLLGPYVQAHLRVYGDPKQAQQMLEPIANHLTGAGLGTISEIFDGDPPHTPRGCFAQAWSVAEVLRVWMAIAHAES
ncbi:MAG: amylo-alpha-1,6-glucosidase [Elainellaceae cyanobacterium]